MKEDLILSFKNLLKENFRNFLYLYYSEFKINPGKQCLFTSLYTQIHCSKTIGSHKFTTPPLFHYLPQMENQ
jgi:hypothetical protein